ncbi:unnamed protein product [Lactuca saligna]|uniref:FBD domain-containing protein n=1 Tax=Lactuca saligna TaxID=75948 RepID=A0AA35ZGX7_LACSI|nr:unnamed protein product [Lactuca saligna]
MFSPIDESEDIEMPYCLVTCGSLEVLRLCLLGYHLCLPKITGFSALRVLELNDVTLKKGDLVKYFLESCPLLEDLSLLHCYADKLVIACPKLKNLRIENRERVFDYEIEDYIDCRMSSSVTICCPKLVLLNLTGSVSRDFILYNLYSLKKAVILCRDFLNQLDPPCDFFERISQVESLSISLYCVGQCYWPEEDEPVSLPNLETLEITVDAVHRLIPFLKCFPDLESLHLIFINESSLLDLMEKFFYRADKCKLKNAATINFVTPRLKKVEFHDYDEEHLALARALFENGSALEEMVFIWVDEAKFHEKSLETMNQVSNFHKASSNVKLRFVINPRQAESILAPRRFEVDSSNYCIYIINNRPMDKSKQANASEGEDGVDLISNLPDHVLQLILSGIPSTEEAIRTSILSRRWRHLWTSIPSIDIDYTRGLDPDKELENESEDVEVPHCLVTCGSLEVLRLCLLGDRLCVPKITGFPALRVLELNDVTLKKTDVLKYFLESCPLLEDLTLLHCDANCLNISFPKLKSLRIENRERTFDYEVDEFINCRMSFEIQISCPKLVFLNLTGSLACHFLFENLYSLKKAVIHIKDFFQLEEPTFDVFDELSQVESLSISLYCIEQCYWPDEDEPISLLNLKTLEITVDDPYGVHMLIPFLKCFPDLESLHLIFIKYVYGLDELNLKDAETISILTRCLKKVEFLEFDEEKPKLVVARGLLEHGKELEEMVFSWSDEAKFHERSMETMNQVSEFHKASSAVKLRFLINPT